MWWTLARLAEVTEAEWAECDLENAVVSLGTHLPVAIISAFYDQLIMIRQIGRFILHISSLLD